MEVLYYQLATFASTVLAFGIFGPRVAVFVCVAWTLWTLGAVERMPLGVLQIAVTWGALWACSSFSAARSKANAASSRARVAEASANSHKVAVQNAVQKVSELETEIARIGAASWVGERIGGKVGAETTWRIIEAEAHHLELYEAIRLAEVRVCITSGWLGQAALAPEFLACIREAIDRGVCVYLAFGWEDTRGQHAHSYATSRAIEALAGVSHKRYKAHELAPARLYLSRYATHEKLVVTDKSMMIENRGQSALSHDGRTGVENRGQSRLSKVLSDHCFPDICLPEAEWNHER